MSQNDEHATRGTGIRVANSTKALALLRSGEYDGAVIVPPVEDAARRRLARDWRGEREAAASSEREWGGEDRRAGGGAAEESGGGGGYRATRKPRTRYPRE